MNHAWFDSEIAKPLLTVAKIQLEYLALRALPFLIYGTFARRLGGRRRAHFGLLLLGIVVASSLWPWYASRLMSDLIALSYYLCAACTVPLLEPVCASGLLRRDAAFAVFLALFVFIPATFFGLFAAIPMLAFGWCVALSAHSFCIEARRVGAHGLRSCLFFLLVDPALVYIERARPDGDGAARVLVLRIAAGFLCMVAGTFLLALLLPLAKAGAHAESYFLRYANTMLATLPAFVALYWLRSGFADVQIGLTRAVGHTVGECFDRPYLARSPSDFWRRWNMYVGHWARRYVHSPLSLWLLRRMRRAGIDTSRLELDKVLSVLGSFIAIGVLHDALNYAGESTTRFSFLIVFGFAAFALLLWEAAGRAHYHAFGVREDATPWGRGVARLYLAHYLVAMVALSGALR